MSDAAFDAIGIVVCEADLIFTIEFPL